LDESEEEAISIVRSKQHGTACGCVNCQQGCSGPVDRFSRAGCLPGSFPNNEVLPTYCAGRVPPSLESFLCRDYTQPSKQATAVLLFASCTVLLRSDSSITDVRAGSEDDHGYSVSGLLADSCHKLGISFIQQYDVVQGDQGEQKLLNSL
jgi:hypothetical protein